MQRHAASQPRSLAAAPAHTSARRRHRHRRLPRPPRAADEAPDTSPGGEASTSQPSQTAQPAAKVLWYAADALGTVLAAGKPRAADTAGALQSISAAQRKQWLLEDYAVDYFISGRGELRAYAPDCEFADPFVSFTGTARFLKNVSGLGTLFQDVKLEVLSLEDSASALQSEWRFAASLPMLPWNPRLFCRGGTTHTFDPATGLVVRHYERWDLEVGEVLKQLFTPRPRK